MLTKTKLAIALAALGLGFATSSFARHGADDPKGDVKGEGAGHPFTQQIDIVARRGADDPKGDVKGEGAGHPVAVEFEVIARRGRGKDDKPGSEVEGPERRGALEVPSTVLIARRGRGVDDKPGDDRGVHAPGHPLSQDFEIVARRGADDAPGHIRREDRRADRRQS